MDDRGQEEHLNTAPVVVGEVLTELGSQKEQEGPQGSAWPPAYSGHTRLSGHGRPQDRQTEEH